MFEEMDQRDWEKTATFRFQDEMDLRGARGKVEGTWGEWIC